MLEGLFQPMHLMVILGLALLVFGPKKLPELGRGIGDGLRALKQGLNDDSSKSSKKAEENKALRLASARYWRKLTPLLIDREPRVASACDRGSRFVFGRFQSTPPSSFD